MPEWKAGDLVRVKSGGPTMTVEKTGKTDLTDEEKVWCEWFQGAKRQTGTFSPNVLVSAENETVDAPTVGKPTVSQKASRMLGDH